MSRRPTVQLLVDVSKRLYGRFMCRGTWKGKMVIRARDFA